MTLIRMLFLGLAVVGAVVPMRFFVAWFLENGWSLGGMITAWHANAATSGLVYDLTIAAIALTVWVVVEARKAKAPQYLLAIPATFLIGVSCGLPLFIYLRLSADRV